MIIKVENSFEAWKVKPMAINKWADLYNDTCIRLRRNKVSRENIRATDLCWLAYARYFDMYVTPDEVVFDSGDNAQLANVANLWFGNDSVLLKGRPLCEQ